MQLSGVSCIFIADFITKTPQIKCSHYLSELSTVQVKCNDSIFSTYHITSDSLFLRGSFDIFYLENRQGLLFRQLAGTSARSPGLAISILKSKLQRKFL